MNPEVRLKVCGITSPEDARLIYGLGADFLGVVFTQSPRRVSIEDALRIRDAVPDAMLVGVFADANADQVVSTSRLCALDAIQLHGNEPPHYCDDLQLRTSLPLIKALTGVDAADANGLRYFTRTSFFLFDLQKRNGAPMSEDQRRDEQRRLWENAALTRRMGFRIFLAGALDPGNVKDVLRLVAPYAVDVSRGVEKSPGVKDHQRLRAFIQEVKG